MLRNSSRILVVDGLSETTEVLKAVLEPRGHAVSRLRPDQLADQPRPHLVIWHDDESNEWSGQLPFGDVPRILIGKTRVADSANAAQRFSPPFQYSELMQAIEQLLDAESVAA